MSDHVTPAKTERGFQHLPPIAGSYGGEAKVYESSAATHPHIWLDISGVGDAAGNATLHMPIERAQQLAEQILYLVQNHYHNNIP